MVKQFKNRVRIADVQKEFDTLCSRIDNLNQKIQDVTEIGEDFDYSEGSSQLAAAGYTLTVGGLKKVLEACDGTVLGARAFRVNDSHIKMSGGYLITKDGGYRLPDSYLTIPQKFRTLYFNPETKQYQWTAKGSKIVIVEEEKLITSYAVESTNFPTYYYFPVYGNNKANQPPIQNPNTSYNWKRGVWLYKWNETENIDENLANGCFETNIANYEHVLCPLKDECTILIDGVQNNYNSTCIVLGYLDGDTNLFTPKMKFDHDHNGYGTTGSYKCNFSYSNPNLTKITSNSDTNVLYGFNLGFGENNQPDHAFFSNGDKSGKMDTKIHFYIDELNNQKLDVSMILNGTEYSVGSYTMSNKLSDYKINCIIGNFNPSAVRDEDATDTGHLINENRCIVTDENNVEHKLNLTEQSLTYYVEREVEGDDAAYKICDINMNRGSIYANDHFGVQNENIYGTYEISIPNRTFPAKEDNSSGKGKFTGWLDWGSLDSYLNCYEAVDNSSAPKFVVPICCAEADDGDRYEVYFDNLRIAYRKGLHRWCNWQTGMNYIYLPKGVANPFNYKLHHVGWDLNSYSLKTDNPTKCSAQKQFNVKISKKLKQKTL